MDIAVKKIELIEWLTKIQDESLLEKLENFKNQAVAQTYESKMKAMSIPEYESLLDKAEDDYKSGKTTSQDEIEKKFGLRK